jgi:hypothetical protein
MSSSEGFFTRDLVPGDRFPVAGVPDTDRDVDCA